MIIQQKDGGRSCTAVVVVDIEPTLGIYLLPKYLIYRGSGTKRGRFSGRSRDAASELLNVFFECQIIRRDR